MFPPVSSTRFYVFDECMKKYPLCMLGHWAHRIFSDSQFRNGSSMSQPISENIHLLLLFFEYEPYFRVLKSVSKRRFFIDAISLKNNSALSVQLDSKKKRKLLVLRKCPRQCWEEISSHYFMVLCESIRILSFITGQSISKLFECNVSFQ